MVAAIGAEKDNAVDLARFGEDIRVGDRIHAKAPAYRGDILRSEIMAILHRGEHIHRIVLRSSERSGSSIRIRVVTAKLYRDGHISRVSQRRRLFPPTRLVESAPVGEHDRAVCRAINISRDCFCASRQRDRDRVLCEGMSAEKHYKDCSDLSSHALSPKAGYASSWVQPLVKLVCIFSRSRSTASSISRSISFLYGTPLAAQSFGYMLIFVKPGMVLISFK